MVPVHAAYHTTLTAYYDQGLHIMAVTMPSDTACEHVHAKGNIHTVA
jgi:hypothetical protein